LCCEEFSKSEKSSQVNFSELLCEPDQALQTQSYEIVSMGDQNAFSIADINQEAEFDTYIQFDFPLPAEAIRLQVAGLVVSIL
jgi:hypothetical protein